MVNITNNAVSKLFVGFVAVAMVFMLSAAPTSAQSADELQAMIEKLLAEVGSLQGQLGQGGTSASGICPYTWTRTLNTGATGSDVMKLQQFLNANVDTRVAATGAGSVGAETEYYGPLTGAAVAKFQTMYRTEVLSPLGLVNPTTYFGPSTMAQANRVCVETPPVVVDDVVDDVANDDDDTANDDDEVTLGGEADLNTVSINSADNDEVNEGNTGAEIGSVDIEFANGDARITRMDIQLIGSGDETDPWDTFDSISLLVDDEVVGEQSADSRSDYLGDEDNGILRFSGLDIVGMEDEEFTVMIAADLPSSIDGTSDGEAWTVSVNNIRFTDGDDVTTTDSTTGDLNTPTTVSFTINEIGGDDEIIIKTSSDDPAARTFEVKDDGKSDWYTIFIFDIDTDDSVNDITLNTVPVSVTVSSSTYNALVDDARLVIDGTTVESSSVDVAGGGTATGIISFDVDDDVVIDAGDRPAAELQVRFKTLPGTGDEGTTVTGSVTGANANAIDARGADDLTNTGTDQLRGSATGKTHTIRTSGISVQEFSSTEAATAGAADDGSYGTFTLTFDVVKVGDGEVFIPLTSSVYDNTGSTTMGAAFSIETGGSAIASTSADALTSSLTRSSGGDITTASGYVRLDGDGDTATFKLQVTLNPGTVGANYTTILTSVGFAETAVPATDVIEPSPAADYDSDPLFITS